MEGAQQVQDYTEMLGVTFPILLDINGSVSRDYNLLFAFPTGAFPRDFVVGTDGRIVYANNEPDVEAMEQLIVDELEE